MKEQKKAYKTASVEIVSLNRDLLITSGGTLAEDGWDSFAFRSF